MTTITIGGFTIQNKKNANSEHLIFSGEGTMGDAYDAGKEYNRILDEMVKRWFGSDERLIRQFISEHDRANDEMHYGAEVHRNVIIGMRRVTIDITNDVSKIAINEKVKEEG